MYFYNFHIRIPFKNHTSSVMLGMEIGMPNPDPSFVDFLIDTHFLIPLHPQTQGWFPLHIIYAAQNWRNCRFPAKKAIWKRSWHTLIDTYPFNKVLWSLKVFKFCKNNKSTLYVNMIGCNPILLLHISSSWHEISL